MEPSLLFACLIMKFQCSTKVSFESIIYDPLQLYISALHDSLKILQLELLHVFKRYWQFRDSSVCQILCLIKKQAPNMSIFKLLGIFHYLETCRKGVLGER